MDKEYYKLSYNRDRNAQLVAWHVSRKDLGKMSRANSFRPDADIPELVPGISDQLYGQWIRQGHNCPSGDRTATRAANESTF